MPLDPSISLRVRPVQIESPVNQLAKILQMQGLQQEQEMGRMGLEEKRRGMEETSRLNSLFQSGTDASGLRRAGFHKQALEWEEKQGKMEREKAAGEKDSVETEHKAIGIYRDASQSITDPQTAAAFITTMHSDPRLRNSAIARVPLEKLIAQIPQDPAQLGAWKQQFALGATKFMELNKPTITTRNLGGTTDTLTTEGLTGKTSIVNSVANTQSPDSVASVAEQRRAHNMADARSREANAQGKVPSGYRQKPDGSLEFIPGGPADPNAAKKAAPTEFQGKAAMFGARAQEADRIIAELDGKYSPAGINTKQAVGGIPLIGGGVEAGANLMLSGASQKAEQAQRDFINAVLRLESGAVIAESEFNNAKKQYFPQPGDAKAVIAQKAANRKIAIQGLMNNARTSEPVKQAGGATGDFSPDIDALVKKYGGK
jgi:hypothetical protein